MTLLKIFKLKTLFPTCLLLFLLAVGFTACGPKHTDFDQKEWLNAVSGKDVKMLFIPPETVTEIKEVYKSPGLFAIDDEYYYISDNHSMSIHMYSTKDFQLKHSFGRQGEGPEEFKYFQRLAVYDDCIFISSPGKISRFSKKGTLIKETRCPPHMIPCYPVGDNYVANIYKMPTAVDAAKRYLNLKIVMLDSDFEIEETLIDRDFEGGYKHNFNTGQNEITVFEDQWDYFIYKDKVYFGYSTVDAFNFFVFDADGDLVYDIIRPHPKREIPDAVKEAVSKSKANVDWNKRPVKVKFYQHYRAFCDFVVADERIYIFLFPDENSQRLIVTDLKGQVLEVVLLPFRVKMFEVAKFQFLNHNLIHDGYRYSTAHSPVTDNLLIYRYKICNL
ncbi:MAG: hypothetical protein GY765_01020 [bacterium]|nr:hypothetical protein [bacterium]